MLPSVLGQVHTLLGDNGFYSQANVSACKQAEIEPLLALKVKEHHEPVLERLAPGAPEPQTMDAVI